MAPKDSSDCVVTVTIELGHQANFLKEPSPEGFTHDWTVFVRGYEGSRLEFFVEKVVFKLHKTFKSPVRVISVPPFRVTESGYAGFILPIEIHFKNKQTPRKIAFFYDLFLNAKDSPAINNVRYEKLKFQNPTPEFKAKLIKAGGIEQGAEQIPYDLFGSPVRSEKKALPKIPVDKEKDREKIKKKKKSSPHPKSASPAQSLSSLSPTTSDDDDDDSYTAPLPPPPPPLKKEKEPLKKESSSSSSQPKQELSSSSSSSHKDISKHRSSSSNSSHKERSSSDKDAAHRHHKHKEKDKERERDRSTSHKEGGKKEKESNSQKVVKEHLESHKEREGTHSSGKSSASSSQHENKLSGHVVHKEKEKSLQSKDKDTSSSSSSKEKSNTSSKERDKSSSKEKHSSHKDVSPTLNSESKKNKEDISKEKVSKEKDKHDKKSQKRHLESVAQEDDAEKKKLKRSSSVASTEDKSVKSKSSSGKEKSFSKESKEKESTKEGKDKASKSSSTSEKSKHEKSRHSEKHKHSHSSEPKQKESSVKHSETPHKHEKVSKSETLTQSERLAMTAGFQPQLLLSPLKSKSDPDESPAPSPVPVEKTKLKRNSSPDSQSSAVSSNDAHKSDHEMLEAQADEEKHIVSGLTDSDSDSEEETPFVRSPQKELKSILNKQVGHATQVNKSSSQKMIRRASLEEKMDYEPAEDNAKKPDIAGKYSKEEKRAAIAEIKSAKAKYAEPKIECSDDEVNVAQVNVANSANGCNGLDILAQNGVSIGELIAINEKIEKAQAESNQELLDKVIQVIGETDDFDLNDVALSFDICSIDKNVVLQIQAVLREY